MPGDSKSSDGREPLLPIAAAPLAAPAISEQGSHLQQPEHPTSVTVTVQPPCAGVGTLHTTTADTHAESAEQRNERTVWATAAVPYIYWLRFSVLKMVIGMLYLDPLYSAGGLCGVIGAGTFLAQPRSKLRLAQAFVVGLAMMGAAGILFTLKMVKLLQLVFAVGICDDAATCFAFIALPVLLYAFYMLIMGWTLSSTLTSLRLLNRSSAITADPV
ncbi:hypothetical protein D9Q98_005863 [Chlorella vulgaris]|uniref:Uncharacterized protein n=1 Tax=Chlorella vulgaris TaxID=3077 RepID=A0A9D4TWQ9_CHLVU|nr:hypothetical protein D9Q98_005863 [Chlorella vulgaris]